MTEVNVSTARDTAGAPREADNPRDSHLVRFGADKPLKLDAGVALAPFQVAYKTYGTLNAAPTRFWSATRLPATSTWRACIR
jgi:homoserine O-acetyltransferase